MLTVPVTPLVPYFVLGRVMVQLAVVPLVDQTKVVPSEAVQFDQLLLLKARRASSRPISASCSLTPVW